MSQSKLAISIESKIRRSFHELQDFNIDIFGSVQFFELCIEISSRFFLFLWPFRSFAPTRNAIEVYLVCSWLHVDYSQPAELDSWCQIPENQIQLIQNAFQAAKIVTARADSNIEMFLLFWRKVVLKIGWVWNLSISKRLFTPQRQHTSKFIRNFLM